MLPVSLTLGFLFITITSFTHDHQVTTRELFIPMNGIDCQNLIKQIRVGQSIGKAIDSMSCISADPSKLIETTKPWNVNNARGDDAEKQ